MAGMQPIVRYLILCEDVRYGPANPDQVTLIHLISTIRSQEQPPSHSTTASCASSSS